MTFFKAPPSDEDPDDDAADKGQRHRDRMAARSREQHAKVSEIGEIPAVKNPKRREACRLDLVKFLQEYFPDSTGLTPFSPDHIDLVIPRIQGCCLKGGRTGNAVYRGFAKTTITENAALWAVLYGHRRYVAVFGSDAGAAGRMIDSIKTELQDNDLLYEDFPEVCHAVRALEGKAQRCHSQTHEQKLTHIEWTAERIVLPTIPGSKASGAILSSHGMTAASRGLKHKRPDGVQQRPDFVIIDDPQTDESANSPDQVKKRLNLIRKNILKLGGHRSTIACVVNATVIAADDLVDQLMDWKRNPAWQWVRIPMIRQWADAHESHWLSEYARLRNTFDRESQTDQERAKKAALAYYKKNRKAMDAGANVSWASCFNATDYEISALQHAYNILIDDGPDVFASECQQDPKKPDDQPDELKPDDLRRQCIGLPRGIVPLDCSRPTAYIDVQGSALYWVAAAWGDGFRGHVLDYNIYPRQPHPSLSLGDVKQTLRMAHPKTGPEGAIRAGLNTLIDELCHRTWRREDGEELQIERIIIDAGYSQTLILSCVRQSSRAALLRASKGKAFTAGQKTFSEYQPKAGEELGLNWLLKPVSRGLGRLLHIDVTWWKSFTMDRFATAPGDPGALTIFGKPTEHDEAFSQWLAEYRVVDGTRVVWKLRPGRNNHLLDCLVGNCVAASMLKISLDSYKRTRRKRKRLTTEEVARLRAERNAS